MLIIWGTPIIATVDDVIEELRQEVKLSGSHLLGKYRDVGSDIMMSCIKHKGGMEQNPSMGISKEEVHRGDKQYPAGTVHCFTCGYTADLPTFIADTLGLETPVEGFTWLMDRFLYGTERGRGELKLSVSREKKESFVFPEEQINTWHEAFLNNEEARQYLTKERNISLDVLKLFKVGVKDGRLVFPVRNRFHEVVLLKERSIGKRDFYNTKDAEKVNLLYGIEWVNMDGKWVFVVEGEIDVLTLWSKGFVAVGLMGSHFTEEQAKELKRAGAEKIILTLDNDGTGREGTKKAKSLLLQLGFRLKYFPYPPFKKDVNELSAEELHEAINRLFL